MTNDQESGYITTPEKFPTLNEIDKTIEFALKELFQENYRTGVIKYKKGLYLILPPEFFHFPPAIISYESHPDDDNRVLYVLISLRIPVPCDAIKTVLLGLKNAILFDIEEIAVGESSEKQCYLNIGNRIHSISIKEDPEWFLMMLSSILKAPVNIYPNIRKKETDSEKEIIKNIEHGKTKESEETYIW